MLLNTPSFEPHTLRIWVTKIPAQCDPLLHEAPNLLSISERQRLDRTRHPRKKAEYLQSRMLMRAALSETFGTRLSYWTFSETCDSPPLIAELDQNWHVSLSHSKCFIVFSLAQFKHGIDIELRDPVRDTVELSGLILSDKDKSGIKNPEELSPSSFYRIWCTKEAWFKTLPREMQKETSLSSLSLHHLFSDDKAAVYEAELADHQISLVLTQEVSEVSFQRVHVEGENLRRHSLIKGQRVSSWQSVLS